MIFLKERMKINVDNEDFEVFIERNGDTWIVEIEGVSFNVKTEGSLSNSKQSRKRGGSKRKLSGKISSSIPGKIVSLNVSLDQIVEQGQVIMILDYLNTFHLVVLQLEKIHSYYKNLIPTQES